jgi:hypothetical protein
MTEKKVGSNKDVLGASYVVDFFNEVTQLTGQFSQFKNIVLEMDFKKQGEIAIEPIELDNLNTSARNVRLFCNQVYLRVRALSETAGLKENSLIKEYYDKVCTGLVPKVSDVENFVLEVNKLLVKDVISDLLSTSQSLLNNLYER